MLSSVYFESEKNEVAVSIDKLYKMRKSNDNELSHFGLMEEIMRQSYKKITYTRNNLSVNLVQKLILCEDQ